MKYVVSLVRILVGVLFIFSGLVKANDPLGLSYKIQEFFEVWGLQGFDQFTLAFSIAMIAFEIIAGVALLVGWQIRLFIWLLLLLILFFTFLTGYAVLTDKIKECGCFGDCIKLTAFESFMKDLILMALIIFLFFTQRHIKPLFNGYQNIAVLFFSSIITVSFMWYALHYLPPIDCLPYKKGISITEGMKPPKGSIPDSSVITFVYQFAGKEIEFSADNFPADFNDTAYTYVRRYDKIVRQGNMMPAIKDFSLTNANGSNVTDSILQAPGYKLLLFVRHDYQKGEWLDLADIVVAHAAQRKIPGVLITSISLNEINENAPSLLKRMVLVTCDATAIKTAARANPTLYLLKGDVIVDKWSYADMESAAKIINQLNP